MPAICLIRNSLRTKVLRDLPILIRRRRDFNRSNSRTKFWPFLTSILWAEPGVSSPGIIHHSGKRRIPEKHRSIARTNYRLEAYATLRRRRAAVGSGRWFYHDLELWLDAPKSNVA
jgi:hypothetical protein